MWLITHKKKNEQKGHCKTSAILNVAMYILFGDKTWRNMLFANQLNLDPPNLAK